MRIASVRSKDKLSYLFGAEGSGPLIAVDPGDEVEALIAHARGRPISRAICTSGFGSLPALRTLGARYPEMDLLAHRELCLHLEDAGFERLVPATGGQAFLVDNVPYRVLACPGIDPFAIAILVANEHLFTGETLLVGACGRLDGPGAKPPVLHISMKMLAELPAGLRIYAGRDVGRGHRSTIGEERARNPALTAETFPEFEARVRAAEN